LIPERGERMGRALSFPGTLKGKPVANLSQLAV